MKVKLTRKMLCAVLSLVMVLTSLPLTVFAYDKEKVSALYTAIEDYEEKMNGMIYTNMKAAYDAYVEAYKTYDKYYYTKDAGGVTDQDVDDATSKLIKATNDMEQWSGVTTDPNDPANTQIIGNPITYATLGDGDDVFRKYESDWNDGDNAKTHNKLLYVQKGAEIASKYTGDDQDGNHQYENTNAPQQSAGSVGIYYPTVVAVLDAKDGKPTLPVAAFIARANNNNFWGLYPAENTAMDSTVFSCPMEWKGRTGDSLDFPWNFYGYTDGEWGWDWTRYVPAKMMEAFPGLAAGGDYNTKGNKATDKWMANYLQIDISGLGVGSDGNPVYAGSLTTAWYANVNGTGVEIPANTNSPIYVVDYNAILNAILANRMKLSIGETDTYANGGLGDVIDAFDAAMAFNPASYDYSDTANTINTVNGKMKDIVDNLNNKNKTPDPSEYAALRQSIDNQRSVYESHVVYEGNTESGFQHTEEHGESWNKFVEVYDAARTAMSKAATSGYNDAEGAKKAADDLTAFELQASTPRVNTSMLEYVINNANIVANTKGFKGYNLFTAFDGSKIDSDAINAAIRDAVVSIWGSESNYPGAEYKLEDNVTNQLLVVTKMAAIASLIRNAQVNFDAVVYYAVDDNGHNYSLNSAIDLFNTSYKDKAEEYANYSSLLLAVQAGERFKDPMNAAALLNDPGRENYAQQLVDQYREITIAIVDAIGDLQPAFSFENDWNVINSGNVEPATHVNSVREGHIKLTMDWKRLNNVSYLKTKKIEKETVKTINLDNIEFNFAFTNDDNPQSDYGDPWSQLDAISFDWFADTNTSTSATGTELGRNTVSDKYEFPRDRGQKCEQNLDSTKMPNYDVTKASLSTSAGAGAAFTVKNFRIMSSSLGVNQVVAKWGKTIQSPDDPNVKFSGSPTDFLDDIIGAVEGKGDNGSDVLMFQKNMTTTAMAEYNLTLNGQDAFTPSFTTDGKMQKPTAAQEIKYTNGNGYYSTLMYFKARWSGKNQALWNHSASPYTETVTVVDISNLTDLVTWVENHLANADVNVKYTVDSINALNTALAEAEAPISYWTMSNDAIVNMAQERADAIVNSYNNLEERSTSFEVVGEDNDGDGLPDTDENGEIIPKDENTNYKATLYRLYRDIRQSYYTVASLNNLNTLATIPYSEDYNEGNLTQEQQELLDSVYTSESTGKKVRDVINDIFKNVDGGFKGFKYLNMTELEMMNVPATEKPYIEAERDLLKALTYSKENESGYGNFLVPAADENYQNLLNEVYSLNADAYNTSAIDEVVKENNKQEAVIVNGRTVYGYDYDTGIKEIESAITDNIYYYNVQVNGSDKTVKYLVKSGDSFALQDNEPNPETDKEKMFVYGDAVTVDSGSGSSVEWYCTVQAKNTGTEQKPKYLLAAESCSFNVRGDTKLYIGDLSNEATEQVKITFINNKYVQNTVAFDYAEKGQAYSLANSTAPNRMFYSIDKFIVMKDGAPTDESYTISDSPTFSEDTTLLITYKPIESESTGDYKIVTLRHDNDNQFDSQDVKYNQLVTVKNDTSGVSALMDYDTGKLLRYSGNDYTFYACQDLNVKPLTMDAYSTLYKDNGGDGDEYFDVSITKAPIISGKRAQFVGSFAETKAHTYDIVGAGIVLDAGAIKDADYTPLGTLTLANVNRDKNILNLSVPISSVMDTNQFAVSIGFSSLSGEAKISYVAYISYKDDEGNLKYVYSNVISGDNIVLK